jgi:hypothetical protein
MVTLATATVLSARAGADPISQLNAIAADTIFAGGRPAGAAPLLDFAMVHAAIHDAIQAYEKRCEPYAATFPTPPVHGWPLLPRRRATFW